MGNTFFIVCSIFTLTVLGASVLPAGTGWYSNALTPVFLMVFLWSSGTGKRAVLFGFCCCVIAELVLGVKSGVFSVPFVVVAFLVFLQEHFFQFRPLLSETGFPARKIFGTSAVSALSMLVFLLFSVLTESIVYGVPIPFHQSWFAIYPVRTGIIIFGTAVIMTTVLFLLAGGKQKRYD